MNYDISNDDAVMNDINMLKSHIDLRKFSLMSGRETGANGLAVKSPVAFPTY